MEFIFSAEQEAFRGALRDFLAVHSSEAEVRRLMQTEEGYEPAVWAALAKELDLTGLTVPEVLGGAGATVVDLAIAFEEMGRVLFCAPFLSHVLATSALVAADPTDALGLVPVLAAGTRRATLAVMESPHDWGGTAPSTVAVPSGELFDISGGKHYVLDGHTADVVIVSAVDDRGLCSLFVVERDGAGVDATAVEGMDLTRKLATIRLESAKGRRVGAPGSGPEVLRYVLNLAATLQAAEQVGAAQRALDTSVEYAKMRVQFGRPIGSFQAIKHKCADMFLAVESARSAAQHAAWTADGASDQFGVAASIAKAHCSEALVSIAAENIQIHGGIGFTWEHSAHLYFRRARSSQIMFGPPSYHRELIALSLRVGGQDAARTSA
ncbi:MAG TPA: acyl-CoA dehydrogenase family protein [Jatrophihabitantaceae bacterium]|jgi:alkylation response protein AidB-like acyl-CoA dehydrogenase